jgi:PEP-CTERM motif
MNKLTKLATTVALALSMSAGLAQAADIDTTTSGFAGDIQPFGSFDTATYGQTFQAGGSTLTSFTLYLDGRAGGSGPLDFKGYVGTWDGLKLDSVLYTSDVQTYASNGNGAGNDITAFTFNTGSLSVTNGAFYVAFLSISDLAAQDQSLFYMPSASGDATFGGFVYMNNGTNFAQLTQSEWNSFGDTDVYFKATFDGAVVPEPATWALMIGGFGLAGASLRRRRAATAA